MLVHVSGGRPASRVIVTSATPEKCVPPGETSSMLVRATGNNVRLYWNADDAAANANYLEILTTDAPLLIPARVSTFWQASPGGAGVLQVTFFQT